LQDEKLSPTSSSGYPSTITAAPRGLFSAVQASIQNIGARTNGRFRTAEYTSNDIKWREDLLPQQMIFLLSPSFAGRDHAPDYSVRYAATAFARKIPALSAPPPPGKLRVQIQPVALKAAGEANGTARPSRVEVTIVSA
jgi:hypothetical protein